MARALRRRYGRARKNALSVDRQRFLGDLAASGIIRKIEAKHPSLRNAHERAALADWETLQRGRASHHGHARGRGESDAERAHLVNMAIGRIFRLGSRPAQPGDAEEYERCRAIILNATDPVTADWTPNYARDRHKGAAGD